MNPIPKHHTRDLIVQEDILNKVNELADKICETEEVKQFQQAEKSIKNHERIQTLIATMKKKQKEIVAFESFKNEEMVKKIEGEIEELQNELDQIPLVTQYQQSQTDVNYLIQMVVSSITDVISRQIEIEKTT